MFDTVTSYHLNKKINDFEIRDGYLHIHCESGEFCKMRFNDVFTSSDKTKSIDNPVFVFITPLLNFNISWNDIAEGYRGSLEQFKDYLEQSNTYSMTIVQDTLQELYDRELKPIFNQNNLL